MKRVLITTLVLVLVALATSIGYFFVTFKSVSVPRPVVNDDPVKSLEGFTLPKGFVMTHFATGVENARVIATDPQGTMVVSQPKLGRIVALPDMDSDGVADGEITVVNGLSRPHGIAFKCTSESETACSLYVGETNMLSVFDYDAKLHKATNKRKLLDLPTDGYNQHYTRSLTMMPSPEEDLLLVSVGSSCNVCEERDQRRSKLLFYNTVTGESGNYAIGLRNAVFSAIHPVTGKVWVTEMGRDGLGDDIPPDEVNIIQKGGNYGWPICYGKNIHDGDFDKKVYIKNPCEVPSQIPSHVDLQAHSAPLGLAFIPEEGWDEALWHDLLVAYHGSWNRSVPTGYKIVRLKLSDSGAYEGVEDFITGWLKPDGTRIGRPADIKVFPGGVMYISDDDAGVIYRVAKVAEAR